MDTNSSMEKIKAYIAQAREKILQAMSTERDRRAVLIGVSALFLMILYIVFHSFSSSAGKLEKQAEQLDKQLDHMIELRSEYRGSQEKIKALSGTVKSLDQPLISVVEKIILDENVDRKNFSIRDVNVRTSDSDEYFEEKSVDVDLKKISLNNLVDILYNIQKQSSTLKVSNLSINTKLGKSDSLNVKLRISTYEFKQVT